MNAAQPQPHMVSGPVSMRPKTPHVLRVLHGRAWVTLVGPMAHDNPDLFLVEGEVLNVPAGQHLVLESWPRQAGDQLRVIWQIAYDELDEPSHDQGIACPPAVPKPLPAKAT